LQLHLRAFLGHGRTGEAQSEEDTGKFFHGAILNQNPSAIFREGDLIVIKSPPDRRGDAVLQGDR
jgi:hypothetical protein